MVTAALGVTEREGGLMMAEAAMTARSFACFRASSRHVLNSCFFVVVFQGGKLDSLRRRCSSISVELSQKHPNILSVPVTPSTRSLATATIQAQSNSTYLLNDIHYRHPIHPIKIGETSNPILQLDDIRPTRYTIQDTTSSPPTAVP